MNTKTTEYLLDLSVFEAWQREQYNQDNDQRDPERFARLVKKVIQNELDETEQELVRLYYYEHHSMREIAEIVGSSRSSVCRQINKALNKIYTYLKYAAELYFGREM